MLTLKNFDTGLARSIHLKDYYRKDAAGELPIKWMVKAIFISQAPESIEDLVFTTRSDVWSFGVALWEICTFARAPFALGLLDLSMWTSATDYSSAVPVNQMSAELRKGRRLELPEGLPCAGRLYEMMLACWNINPKMRPKFSALGAKLEGLKNACV